MKNIRFILFSVHIEQARKDARKLAKMYLNAELEEDHAKQQSMLAEAEKFSKLINEKYKKTDAETYEKLGEIMDEEARNINNVYFDSFQDDDDDD
jgi:hypothetical protein